MRLSTLAGVAILAMGCGNTPNGPEELSIEFTKYSLLAAQTDTSDVVLFYGEIHNHGERDLEIVPVVTYGEGSNIGSERGQLYRHFSKTL